MQDGFYEMLRWTDCRRCDIYGVIGEWNVVVDEILAKTNEADLGTYTTSDTPSSILRSFGKKNPVPRLIC